jgi:hypothetical protein
MIKKISLFLLSVLLVGCAPNAQDIEIKDEHGILPVNAKVIKQLGNNWIVFEIQGRRYIYRGANLYSNYATEVLAPWND